MRGSGISAQACVTLEEMLEAREKRADLQRELIRRYHAALICFTMNIPGAQKRFPLQERAFDQGAEQILIAIKVMGAQILYQLEIRETTGCEGFYAVNSEAAALKRLAMHIEEEHPLGRLFDIDVFDRTGKRLSGEDFGRPVRKCILCGEPIWQCRRSQSHSIAEIAAKAVELMREFFASAANR